MPKKRPKEPPPDTPEKLSMLITINRDAEDFTRVMWDLRLSNPLDILWLFHYIIRHAEQGGILLEAAVDFNHATDLDEHMRRSWPVESAKPKKVKAKS
jgi:hypothetical protein